MNDMERMAKKDRERSLTFLTEREYNNLPYWGRWLLDWMARWKPKECGRMKERGTLVEWFDRTGDEILEILDDNKALGESGALEIVKEIYLTNPEPDADRYWGIKAY